MSAVFVPYIDSKQLSMLPESYSSEVVQMSSFIDSKDHILISTGEQYFVYTKYGLLQNKVKFIDENNDQQVTRKLLYISDNLTYYLFLAEATYEEGGRF